MLFTDHRMNIFCPERRIHHYKLTFIKGNNTACGPIVGILLVSRTIWGWGPTGTALQSRMGILGVGQVPEPYISPGKYT